MSWIDTLKNSDLFKTSGEVLELSLKTELGLDDLKDVPFFDMIYSISRAISSIRDKFLVQKVMSFLFELKDFSREEIKAAIAEIEQSTPEFGESLMMVIDQCNNSKKPVILGHILAAYIRGEIKLRKLHDLYYSVQMLDTTLCETLRQFYDGKPVNNKNALQHFAVCGLAEMNFGRNNTAGELIGGPPVGFIKNETGKTLLAFL